MSVLVYDSFYQFSLDFMFLLQVVIFLAQLMVWVCNEDVSQSFLFLLINKQTNKKMYIY